MQYDVFLSSRREGGQEVARSLNAALELTAAEVEFLSSKSESSAPAAPSAPAQKRPEPQFTQVEDEELPF